MGIYGMGWEYMGMYGNMWNYAATMTMEYHHLHPSGQQTKPVIRDNHHVQWENPL